MKISQKFSPINKKGKVFGKRFYSFAQRKPITAFVTLLGLLFLLIVLSNKLSTPTPKPEEALVSPKEVSVYTIGESPQITVQAQVEKSGVIKIVALGSGVVSKINVKIGETVDRGTTLISMSTNYQGGNAFSVQRQIAQTQYKNVLDTYEKRKDVIEDQKDLAEANAENSEELRRIQRESLGGTRSLLELNNNILSTLEQQQAVLESTNVGGANDDEILAVKQMRSQLMSGNLQLESALRNAQYASSENNPPAEISQITKEIAITQLEIEEKALKLNKEISRLNLVMAQINEAIMFPASPISGTVERVYVKEGQAVIPGTPLVQVSGESNSLIAVALLSKSIARGVSSADLSTIHLGDIEFLGSPFYVSSEATDGQLYTAQFSIPQEFSKEVTDKSYITIDIPLGFPQTGETIPFVPIDAVFQTQDEAFLFLSESGKVKSRSVKLGKVLGRYVEIKEGLGSGDQVILNRNVIDGDPITIVN